MSKNENKLKERCDVLEKIVLSLSLIYNDENTQDDQKKLIETILGAAIFYLPHSEKFWTGRISTEAKSNLKKDKNSKLTKEHQFPRKIAAKELLDNSKRILNKEASVFELYINKYGKYNLVTPQENKKISKHQRDRVFVDIESAYSNAEIILIEISLEELRMLRKGI